MPRRAEIAGAGLAGLSVATGLAQRGWQVRVHERASELRMFGAGIWLWENGLRSLRILNAEDQATRNARHVTHWSVVDPSGRELFRREFTPADHMVLPLRADLYQALIDAAVKADVDIVTDSTAISATPDGELTLADGSVVRADLIVAADGVSSRIREALMLTDRISYLREGYTRLLVDVREGDELWAITECWNGSRRFLHCPCTDDVHYIAVSCAVGDIRGRSIPVDREYWSEHFPLFRPLIERIGSGGRWDRGMTVRCTSWSSGRVVLVGDAAHGQAPNLGQGANMTFTNAVSLASALSTVRDDIPRALQEWEARERPLTDHVQRWSHGYGEIVSRWPDPIMPLRAPFLRAMTTIPWVDAQLNRAARHQPVGNP